MTREVATLDQFEEEFRKGLGVETELIPLFNSEVTRDNVKNFADGLGDNNPLWTDEEYAKRSRFGAITAPPTFLYTVNHGTNPVRLGTISIPIRNMAYMYAGAEWEFFQPISLGDRFIVKGKSLDIVRRQTKTLGEVLFARGQAIFLNQRMEVLGSVVTTMYHFPAQEQVVLKHDRPTRDIGTKSPDLLVFERKRRGAEPRYWEDVEVGSEMTPPLEKGMLTELEIIRFRLFCPATPRRIEVAPPEAQPGAARDVPGGAKGRPATNQGLEDISDMGPQRTSWLGQFVTDWMGDDGVLKKLSSRLRHPNMVGDVNVLKGKVTGKYVDSGEHRVDCEIWVENQAGVITAPGSATVALPARRGDETRR